MGLTSSEFSFSINNYVGIRDAFARNRRRQNLDTDGDLPTSTLERSGDWMCGKNPGRITKRFYHRSDVDNVGGNLTRFSGLSTIPPLVVVAGGCTTASTNSNR